MKPPYAAALKVFACAALALLTACPQVIEHPLPDGGIVTSPAGTIPREAFCEALYQEECEANIACGQVSPRCEVDRTWVESCQASSLGTASNPRVHYDGAAVAECFAQLKVPPYCGLQNLSLIPDGPCKRMSVGAQKAGDSCANSAECEPGTYCAGGCNGTCALKKPAGTAATNPFECVDGTYFQDGMCRNYVMPGGSCAPVGTSTSELRCAGFDNWCNGKTCVPRGMAGAACTGSGECQRTLACINNVCGRRLKEGESCQPSTRACLTDLTCLAPAGSSSGVCRQLKDVGAACGNPYECKPQLRCYQGTCAERGGQGESCDGTMSCKPGLFCSNPGLVCVPKVGEGQRCNSFEDCATGLACESGVCSKIEVCL